MLIQIYTYILNKPHLIDNIFNWEAGGRAAPVSSLSEVVLYEYV